jgi:hypothetical protein
MLSKAPFDTLRYSGSGASNYDIGLQKHQNTNAQKKQIIP